MDYKDKYFKYKNKYLNLKNLVGGALEDVISFKANLRITPDKFQTFWSYSDHIISAGKISEILKENFNNVKENKFIKLEFKIKYATIKGIYKIFINDIETDLILSKKNTTSIDWFEKLGRTQYSALISNEGLDIFNDENAELFDKSTNELRKIVNAKYYNDYINNFIKKLQNDNTFLFLTPNYLLKYFNITNEIQKLVDENEKCKNWSDNLKTANFIFNDFYNKIKDWSILSKDKNISNYSENIKFSIEYDEYNYNSRHKSSVQELKSNNQIEKIFDDLKEEEENLKRIYKKDEFNLNIDKLNENENDKNKLNKLILENLNEIKLDITEDLIKDKMKQIKSYEDYEKDLHGEIRIMVIDKNNNKYNLLEGLRKKKRIEDYNSKCNNQEYMNKLNDDLEEAKDVLNDLETNQKDHINDEFKRSKNKSILISTETTKNLKKEEKEYNLIIIPLFNLTDIKINDKFKLKEDFNIKNLLNCLTEEPSE